MTDGSATALLTPAECFAPYLPDELRVHQPAEAFAPSNIALGKYWGKRDPLLNLPLNSSLSISLAHWGSHTHVYSAPLGQDEVWFNGSYLPSKNAFSAKVLGFVDLFRRNQALPLRIETINTIPTAAGLASSASGFAALTLALDSVFKLNLPKAVLSMMARFGSGSATRSLWHGFVRWERGDMPDGSDSFATPLGLNWPAFRIAIIPIDTGPKADSSRDGMNHTVATSPLFKVWPGQAEADCAVINRAILARDFTTLGATSEANAVMLHATMLAARPALSYLKPTSWAALEKIWTLRSEGHDIYATMDAGANVKLLFLASEEVFVRQHFTNASVICPFGPLGSQPDSTGL
ncbi:MAG: diphosphomevalonate decarboxylase [Paracoccaceae bacterium]|jgi:diphosphomevalonate decarboxylase|nr:diphosphomevalonate decarboxylase [Paracoccaceae bacterium]